MASNKKFKFVQDSVRQNDNGDAIDDYQWLWIVLFSVVNGYGMRPLLVEFNCKVKLVIILVSCRRWQWQG